MSEAILGIDVSKKKLDVALIFDAMTLKKKFDNTPKGFKLIGGWLMSLHIERVHACLESTGTYGEAVAEFLHEKGHRVSVVNPFRIKAYANTDLKRNKTDPADAYLIADFCRVKKPDEWHPLPPEVKHLQALTRRIEALDQMLNAEKNRLEVAPPKVRPSVKRIIRTLETEIRNIQRVIKEHIDDNPDMKEQNDLLLTIPGIGQTTSQLLLGEVDFRRFDSARAVAAQAGLTPRKDQSGTSLNRTRLSKVGNARIRKALYFPALTALKYNQTIKQFASRLSQKGKVPMEVICAAMRKLLHIAFGVLKNKTPFVPNLAHSI